MNISSHSPNNCNLVFLSMKYQNLIRKTLIYLGFLYILIHQKNSHFFSLIENNSGVGASGYGAPGPTWDRGANLKDYYSRREEQEVQAVRLSLVCNWGWKLGLSSEQGVG